MWGWSGEEILVIKDQAVRFYTLFNGEILYFSIHKQNQHQGTNPLPFKKVLTYAGRGWLSREIFSELELAVKEQDLDKAPNQDGFTYDFYHKTWDLIKDDLWAAISYFSKGVSILKEINHTFITLAHQSKKAVRV